MDFGGFVPKLIVSSVTGGCRERRSVASEDARDAKRRRHHETPGGSDTAIGGETPRATANSDGSPRAIIECERQPGR